MQLSIRNLNKTYTNGLRALTDVSLTFHNGMFGLLGPNGAGKSSLMRTIATLQEPDSGSISFDGLDVLKQKHEVRKVLGYLPQEFGVYPKIAAGVMLDHIADLKGIVDKKQRKEIVSALLERVNLTQVKNKYLGTFSGGMRQRFGVAQALIGNPKLIIIDEPTAGLDPAERNRFYNLLSEIGENTIVILSTHIVEDVTNLCNAMAIICSGEVIAQGNPNDLIDSMKGKIWTKSIEKNELTVYRNSLQVISTQLKAGKTQIRVVGDAKPDESFTVVEPNLEDVYFTRIESKTGVVNF